MTVVLGLEQQLAVTIHHLLNHSFAELTGGRRDTVPGEESGSCDLALVSGNTVKSRKRKIWQERRNRVP